MRSKLLVLLFITLFKGVLLSQNDSVVIPTDLNIPDAVYITYNDFRYNKGILKDQIVSSGNKDQLDFVGKALDKEVFSFTDGQKSGEVKSKIVWGFFQNKTLYINYKGSFYRVPVFGSVCYLVATVEVVGVGFYDPMFGYGSGRRQEVREFLINFYDGMITEFSMSGAELLLSRDKLIYAEYKELSKRKQREQIFRYLRKYNEAHPVYFLK
ncbi:MAG: hypothetical protein H0U95_16535 [Bacteroidetes bacterium]|nr:hypothetical protein [Bacteroidota bacterium]